ncbi:unnamed protein product [Didymodactylos carnosus]|uniref:Uncharacterized protein n=1 Tax=Didymodactylos carnosus TaxID=1234261 RepID=A0A814WKF8_9BILA|nr:unnamed protein product [Didymodactylos carnosus]CAF1203529.1 unnamed protein product [Didymodactylos carnosus]CAF3707893.1 unnamed protein product [Didymodactylos carnosus]CAF3967901.1 unnamed protein product [Didymodactylos carnosus]
MSDNLIQPLTCLKLMDPKTLGSKHRARRRRGRRLSRKLPSRIGRLVLNEKVVPNSASISTTEHIQTAPMSRSTQTTKQRNLQIEAASTIQPVTPSSAPAALLIDAIGGRKLSDLKRMLRIGTNDLLERSAMNMIAIVEEIVILLRGVNAMIDILFCEIGPRHFRGNHKFPPDDDHTLERILAYNSLLANVCGCGVLKLSYTLSDSIDGLHPGPIGLSTVVRILKAYFD